VTAIFASSAGLRNDTHITSWPSSILLVDAASAARMVQPSWMASAGLPAGPDRKWSQTHSESSPTASAWVANARISRQVGSRPGPSDAPNGNITPILIDARA
jgi:hypothetical protein